MSGTKPSAAVAKATRRIEAAAYGKAVELLVAAWRRHRSDRLASLVDRVSDLAGERLLPVDLEGDKLVAALAALDADPRFAREVVAELARPWQLTRFARLWQPLADLLVAQQDPRALELIGTLGTGKALNDPVKILGESYAKRMRVPRPEPVAELEVACETCERACEAAEVRLAQGGARGAALLAAIHAEPGDRDLRAIYADWLVEQGDPRGEYITLQLLRDQTDAQRARMHDLHARHRTAWLGPIADACVDHVWFDAGFPAGATIDIARARRRRGAAAWSTLETITLAPSNEPVPIDVLGDPGMTALTFVDGITANQLAMLSRDREAWDIAGLGFYRSLPANEMFRILNVVEHLGLTTLGFDSAIPPRLRELWASERSRGVTRLRVLAPLAQLVDWVAAAPPTVATVELANQRRAVGWTLAIARGPDGRFADLDVLHRARTADDTAPIGTLIDEVIAAVPAGQLARVALRLAGSRAGAAELARLAAAIATRHPRATVELPR